MSNLNQIRFRFVVCLLVLKRYESLTSIGSNHFCANKLIRHHKLSQKGLCKLHSTTPLQYQEASDDLVSKQSNFVVFNNDEPKVTNAQTLEGSNDMGSVLSIPLIKYICMNQALFLLFASSTAVLASFFGDNPFEISSLHWNDIKEFHSLFDWQPSFFRSIQGCLASIPMLAGRQVIQNSDDCDASSLNFATTNMVLCLFGRRKSVLNPKASAYTHVFLLSVLIAISSGVSEEIIFRGYIPTAISAMTRSLHLALLGQAVLFASGHLSRNAQLGENKINWSLQFFSGIWYGVLYLITGGDIFPCIIAHILYDVYTLCETWTRVNDQLDYTHESSMKCTSKEEEKASIRLQSKTAIDTETINFARHFFYAFDNDHAGSLSLSDCQRAVSYAFINDTIEPDMNAVKDLFAKAIEQRCSEENSSEFHDRLDFPDFLYILFVVRSRSREFCQ